MFRPGSTPAPARSSDRPISRSSVRKVDDSSLRNIECMRCVDHVLSPPAQFRVEHHPYVLVDNHVRLPNVQPCGSFCRHLCAIPQAALLPTGRLGNAIYSREGKRRISDLDKFEDLGVPEIADVVDIAPAPRDLSEL